MPRVFITGLGFVTSIGNDAATVTRNLRELRHGFEPVSYTHLTLPTIYSV